ncbi:hypothetical protein GGR52DRAFT_201115 [Hypoxylon sp. FL1284]|nr:hypothetical protein GGR52DRAFT_201115 [Hypoxylon sp. FL1284]
MLLLVGDNPSFPRLARLTWRDSGAIRSRCAYKQTVDRDRQNSGGRVALCIVPTSPRQSDSVASSYRDADTTSHRANHCDYNKMRIGVGVRSHEQRGKWTASSRQRMAHGRYVDSWLSISISHSCQVAQIQPPADPGKPLSEATGRPSIATIPPAVCKSAQSAKPQPKTQPYHAPWGILSDERPHVAVPRYPFGVPSENLYPIPTITLVGYQTAI